MKLTSCVGDVSAAVPLCRSPLPPTIDAMFACWLVLSSAIGWLEKLRIDMRETYWKGRSWGRTHHDQEVLITGPNYLFKLMSSLRELYRHRSWPISEDLSSQSVRLWWIIIVLMLFCRIFQYGRHRVGNLLPSSDLVTSSI